ncbi:hypothetical protein HY637_01325 [Candidatus Woesearchaeota archaeon]|nr:hypothetical protein [Candidatus Woesearchaeota archaeon]
MKKTIMMDLDVVTVAIWDKKDEMKLLEKIKGNEFAMITPYIILEHLSKWNYRKLAEEIASFYEKYSFQIVTAQNIADKTEEMDVDYKKLFIELLNIGVKEEDIVLVIIVGIFDIDFLVTFNRKHLKSKEKEINEVLRRNGINAIRIVQPSEL